MTKIIGFLLIAVLTSCTNGLVLTKEYKDNGVCKYTYQHTADERLSFEDSCNKVKVGDRLH